MTTTLAMLSLKTLWPRRLAHRPWCQARREPANGREQQRESARTPRREYRAGLRRGSRGRGMDEAGRKIRTASSSGEAVAAGCWRAIRTTYRRS
jgi:hypothetical protein